MKINPTSSCLSLVLHAIDNAVLPEVTSVSAKGALGLIRNTLIDLLKRQAPSVELLRQCNASGEILRREALQVLELPSAMQGAHGSSHDDPESLVKGFEELSKDHEELTRKLNELCVCLSIRNDAFTSDFLRRVAEWELVYYSESQKLEVDLWFHDKPGTPGSNIESLAASNQQVGPKPHPLSLSSIREFLRSHRGTSLNVLDFSQMTGGYGKQTYSCLIKYEDVDETEDLIVRKCDAIPIIEHGGFRVEQEFELLQALSTTSFPAPRPIELGFGLPGVDGAFYTMNRLSGYVPSSFLGITELKLSDKLVLRLAELLGKLHSIPLSIFSDYIEKFEEPGALQLTVEERYRRNIRGWRRYVERIDHLSSPYLTWLFEWLEQNIPRDTRPAVLTHGDFNFHNIMVDGDDVTGVLDWECADFGAPEQDIVYVQQLVTRHMSWDRFLQHYAKSGGKPIKSTNFPFCQAYSVLRTMIAFNRATLTNQLGSNRDIRFMMVTFGINAAFMEMGLTYTAPIESPQESKVANLPTVDQNPHEDVDVDDLGKISVSHYEGVHELS